MTQPETAKLRSCSMQRLKTRPQFQAVLSGGIVAKTEHFSLHRSTSCTQTPEFNRTTHALAQLLAQPLINASWLGAVVPKRLAKHAVTRNTIKRQVYTTGAALLRVHPHAAFVVRLHKGFTRSQFVSTTSEQLKKAIRTELTALLQMTRISRKS